MKTKTEYVIQRFIHRSFGTHESHWSDTSPDSFKINNELSRKFTRNRNDEEVAAKVIMALSKARPAESFRVVCRTIVTTDEIGLQAGPRKPFSTKDLKEYAINNASFDGVRTFNGMQPALIEANLDPCNFGAIASKLVIHVVDTMNNPKDEWILVHSDCHSRREGYPKWNVQREWWNLKLRKKIVSDDDFGKSFFRRHDYGKGEHRTNGKKFKTFKGAVNQDKRQLGHVTKEEIVKRFPKVKEL